MTRLGWLSVLIPDEYGGGGQGVTEAGIILEEIHRSGGNANACHAQLYTMGALARHGSEEQKRRWLPPLAAGELRLQAFGITEPDAGSDSTQIATRAERDGGDYVVTGQKTFISRAEQTDLMLLLARTGPPTEADRAAGLSLFLARPAGGRRHGGDAPHPADVQLPHLPGVLFRPAGPGRPPHRRGRARVPARPRRF